MKKGKYTDIANDIWRANAEQNKFHQVAKLIEQESDLLKKEFLTQYYPFATTLHTAMERYSAVSAMLYGICEKVFDNPAAATENLMEDYTYYCTTKSMPEGSTYTVGTLFEWMEVCDNCWLVCSKGDVAAMMNIVSFVKKCNE